MDGFPREVVGAPTLLPGHQERANGDRGMKGSGSERGSTTFARFLSFIARHCFLFCSALIVALAPACSRPMAPPRPYLALAAVGKDHSVAVASLASFRVLRIIPLAYAPRRVVLRPGSREVYVTSADGILSIIRYPDLAVAATLRVPQGATGLTFSPAGDRAYGIGGGGIFVLDCNLRKITRCFPLHDHPSGIALTSDGKVLLAEDRAAGQLVFVNAADGQVLGKASAGKQPGSMVILPRGKKVFVADPEEETVAVLDIASRQLLSEIQVGGAPGLLALKPDGGELFVFSPQSSLATILNTSYNYVEQTVSTGTNPVAAVFTHDSSLLYIANEGDGTVTTLNVPTRQVVASIRVGIKPVALALTPDERFLAVADAGASSLAIMRARAPALITTIPVGDEPESVVVPDWIESPRSRASAQTAH